MLSLSLVKACLEAVADQLASPREYPILAIQFCIGALAGSVVRKTTLGALAGVCLTLLMVGVGIIEAVVVWFLCTYDGPDAAARLPAAMISTLDFLVMLWVIWIAFALAGYCAAFIVSRRLTLGRGQLTLGALLIIVALYGAIAAYARVLH